VECVHRAKAFRVYRPILEVSPLVTRVNLPFHAMFALLLIPFPATGLQVSSNKNIL